MARKSTACDFCGVDCNVYLFCIAFGTPPAPIVEDSGVILTPFGVHFAHVFANAAKMEAHITSIHGESKTSAFTCTKCQKYFKSKQVMEIHIKVFHGEKLMSENTSKHKIIKQEFQGSRVDRSFKKKQVKM